MCEMTRSCEEGMLVESLPCGRQWERYEKRSWRENDLYACLFTERYLTVLNDPPLRMAMGSSIKNVEVYIISLKYGRS